MKNKSTILSVLHAGVLLLFLFSCKKEEPATIPTITGNSVTNITANSATAGGTVTTDGGDQVTSRGVCWSSTNATPSISDSKTSDGTGIGNFTSSILGLTAGTPYNLRAYATNSVGTAYSSPSSFKTLSSGPVIATTDYSNVTSNSFNIGGNVTSDGGSSITARGVCWSTNQNPSITDSKTSDGIGSGIFTSLITGLLTGKTYYVRAYATNNIGTSYGSQITITTLATLPTIKTAILVTYIQATIATSGGEIISDGGGAITARGVCWSTSIAPTIASNKTSDGTGSGIFSSSISGLTALTTYYVRAYATNSAGTAYGSELSFKTTADLPTLTTNSVTLITNITALCGGNIASDGGSTITGRGVCWSRSPNPTLSYYNTSDGIGLGSFSSSITGLMAGTLYYVRSYATNSIGTKYGEEKSFTTIEMLPSITTSTATSINENMALCEGDIISTGGHEIIEYGVIVRDKATGTYGGDYNLGSNYSSFTGKFSAQIKNLDPDTEYNFYAYVTTSAGTSTGEVLTFRTMPLISVSDYEGNKYTATQIGTQVWLNEDLRSTKFNDGSIIGWYQDNTSWAAITSPGYCSIPSHPNRGPFLYNYYAVNTGKLCPVGWHVPTDSDWKILINFLGGNSVAGGKLKYPDVTGGTWTLPNIIDQNGSTNFSALAGVYRYVYYDMFDGWTVSTVWSNSSFGSEGNWWTSTINPLGAETTLGYKYGTAYRYYISNGSTSVTRGSSSYKTGCSVRCIKD